MRHPASLPAVIAVVFSFTYADSVVPFSLAVVETLLVTQHYDSARKSLAGHVPVEKSEENYALYLRVVLDQTELLDYESYHIGGERFLKVADSARCALEKRLPELKGRDSTLCLFYLGNIYGGMSIIRAKRGSWLPAVKSSMISAGFLKEALQRDSSLVAARLGIGGFNYYLSKSYTWLPFIDADSERRGVREIELAASAPFPFGFAAKNTLCWILIDKKKFDRADSVALSALEELPGSTIFQRIRCLNAFWSGRYDRALGLAQKLAEASLMRDPVNWSDYVMAYYVLAGSYEGLGKIKEALAASRHILETKMPAEFREIPPVRKNLKRVLEIKNKCLR